MKTWDSYLVVSASITITFCSFTTAAFGEVKTFTVDPSQSSLTITGSFAGIGLGEQGPNSLTTHYGGFINADVTPTTIQFTAGSSIVASNNGNWQPGLGGTSGAAPANYGGQISSFLVSGKAAVRNVNVDITSGAISISAGTFPASGLEIGFPTNASTVVDYTYTPLFGTGDSASKPLAGHSTNNVLVSATLATVGEELVLTIPINYSGYVTAISPNDVEFIFAGQLVAKAQTATPLQIGTFQVTPGQLKFTIATLPGHSYAILGSTDLSAWSMTNDTFVATETLTTRNIPLPTLPGLFFRIRQDN